MKKNLKLFIIFAFVFFLFACQIGCKRPHKHSYVEGKCECGEVSPNFKTVTFELNNGSEPYNIIIESGRALSKQENPTREGYQFDGWYWENHKWNFLTDCVTEDITLVARWIIKNYSIKLDAADGKFEWSEIDEFNKLEFKYGDELSNDNLPVPFKAGYKFIGWDRSLPERMPAEDISLTALWEKDDFYDYVSHTDDWTITGPYTGTSKVVTVPYPLNYDGNTDLLPNMLFQGNTNIETIIISEGIKIIGSSAFVGCTNLKKIILPESMNCFGKRSIADCSSLEFNVYENGNYLGSKDNPYKCLVSLNSYSSILNIHPDTTHFSSSFLNDYGFFEKINNCKNIVDIGMYLNPTYYGFKNFTVIDNCLYFGDSENPYRILVKAFGTELMEVNIHPETKIIATKALTAVSRSAHLVIPDGIEYICAEAFNERISSIYIPKSVKYLGYQSAYAFDIYCETDNWQKGWVSEYQKRYWSYNLQFYFSVSLDDYMDHIQEIS